MTLCRWRYIWTLPVSIFFLGFFHWPVVSEARDLSEVLEQGFTFSAPGNFRTADVARAVTPSLSVAVAQAVTQQFPLTSVAPAFTYHYNPALRVWEALSRISFSRLFRYLCEMSGGGRQMESLCQGDHLGGSAVACRVPDLVSPIGRNDAERGAVVDHSTLNRRVIK